MRVNTPLFNLPVAPVSAAASTSTPWISSDLIEKISTALKATEGACSAIVLEAPETSKSRPSGLFFLCPEGNAVALKPVSEMDEGLLDIIAPSALILENDYRGLNLFTYANRLSQGRRYQLLAVTGAAVVGWSRRHLLAPSSADATHFSDNGRMAGAFLSHALGSSSHWTVAAQGEIGPLAKQIYAYEAGCYTDYKLRGQHRSAEFKIYARNSAFA